MDRIYLEALVSQLESSVAFLENRCRKLRKAPGSQQQQADQERAAAQTQLRLYRGHLEALGAK